MYVPVPNWWVRWKPICQLAKPPVHLQVPFQFGAMRSQGWQGPFVANLITEILLFCLILLFAAPYGISPCGRPLIRESLCRILVSWYSWPTVWQAGLATCASSRSSGSRGAETIWAYIFFCRGQKVDWSQVDIQNCFLFVTVGQVGLLARQTAVGTSTSGRLMVSTIKMSVSSRQSPST